MKEVTVSAGEVLTVSLLRKVNKAAYQYGGFRTVGGIVKKSIFGMQSKTTVEVPAKFINGDIDKFLQEFGKTMNAAYYNIKLV